LSPLDGPDRQKVTDGDFTTVHGITQDEAKKYIQDNLKQQENLTRIHGDEHMTMTEKKKVKKRDREALLKTQTANGEFDESIITTEIDGKSMAIQSAFYKFQAKHVRKA